MLSKVDTIFPYKNYLYLICPPDFGIRQVAQLLGNTDDEARYANRSLVRRGICTSLVTDADDIQWYRNVWDSSVKSDGFKGQTIPPCIPFPYMTVVFYQALHKNDTPMEHSTSRTPPTVHLWILARAIAPFNRTTSTASTSPHLGSIVGMLPTILLIL